MNFGYMPHLLRINFINAEFTDYYTDFSAEERLRFADCNNQLHNQYVKNCIDNKNDWFLNLFYGSSLYQYFDRPKITINSSIYDGVMDTCLPGDKLYVLPNGNFGICEKIASDEYIIGNIKDGIIFEKVQEMIDKFNQFIRYNCSECSISRLCGICYASLHLSGEGKLFAEKNTCQTRIKKIKEYLEEIINIEQDNPGYFENRVLHTIKTNFKNKIENKKTISDIKEIIYC
jgi:uncharacterized protein